MTVPSPTTGPSKREFSRYLYVFMASFLGLIGATWAYTASFPMLFEESGYAVWRAKFEAIASCSLGSTIMVGDSRGQSAFLPDRFRPGSYNLSLGAATTLDVYLVFKKIGPCLTPGQHVMISIAPIEFTKISPFLWENGVRYGFFSFADIRELSAAAAEANDPSFRMVDTRFGTGLVRDVVYGVHFPSIYTNNLVSARVWERRSINENLLSRAKALRGFLPFSDQGGVGGTVDEASLSDFKPLPVQDLITRRIIALAKARQIKLDFVAAPMSDRSAAAISAQFKASFIAYLESLDPSQSTFKVVTPLFYGLPNELFADNYHVNEAGAEVFTRWLARCTETGACVEPERK